MILANISVISNETRQKKAPMLLATKKAFTIFISSGDDARIESVNKNCKNRGSITISAPSSKRSKAAPSGTAYILNH